MRKNWCLTYWSHSFYYIWAASQPNQQNGMCASWPRGSTWTSTQSDQSSLSTWGRLKSLAIIRVHSEASDQTGWFESSLGANVILLVLSWGGSFYFVSLASPILISAKSRRFISWNSPRKWGFYVSMHMYVSVYDVILQTSCNTHLYLSRWSTRLTVHIAFLSAQEEM